MGGSCCPGDYHRFFSKRFARRLARKYQKRGLDKTARKMADFLRDRVIEGATVLEIGGGVGEIEIELLKAGAARTQNLELSPGYEQEARKLAEEAGVGRRVDWRIHDIARDSQAVEPADIVVMHRVVCCYPDYDRLLGAAADHARRALVFSYPPRNVEAAFAASPTRRARCSPCSRGADYGERMRVTSESGASPASSAVRKLTRLARIR